MRDNLIKLAERVEAADGPDRVLDAEIYIAVRDGLPQMAALTVSGEVSGHVPAVTASIDAALTLVNREHWLELCGPRKYLNIPTPSPNYWSANVTYWGPTNVSIGWGATPALALTATALRALATD